MSPTPAAHLKFSSRLDGVHESATLKLNGQVQAMKARGVDVMNLTAGEPDFPVPEAAKKAVRKALDENRSKYTPAPGIPELRELIAAKTNVQQRAACGENPWRAADVIVTNGGKQALFNAFLALLNAGVTTDSSALGRRMALSSSRASGQTETSSSNVRDPRIRS
jgi:aspartate aminotransferase